MLAIISSGVVMRITNVRRQKSSKSRRSLTDFYLEDRTGRDEGGARATRCSYSQIKTFGSDASACRSTL
jgi:hypothetical protein